jgi:hypothetical protein
MKVESFTNRALALERERLIRLIQNDGEEGRDDGIDNESPLPVRLAEKILNIIKLNVCLWILT